MFINGCNSRCWLKKVVRQINDFNTINTDTFDINREKFVDKRTKLCVNRPLLTLLQYP